MNSSNIQHPPLKNEYYLMLGQKKIQLLHKQTIIGRNPNATIYIEDHSIAKEHAIIQLNQDNNEPTLVDRGSVAGCKINGKQIPKNSLKRIYNGDCIKFGNYPLEYIFQSTDNECIDDSICRDSLNSFDQKIRLAPDQPQRYATMDHLRE